MNNRIDFDYDKIKDGYKPVTRNGIYPTEVHRFETYTESQRIVAIFNGERRLWYDDNGKWRHDGGDDYNDLFLEPPVRVEWWNVYPGNNRLPQIYKHETLEDAKEHMPKDYAAWGMFTQRATYQGDELISVELVTVPKNTNER